MERLALALLVSVAVAENAFGLGQETIGNEKMSAANFGDWPHVLPVINDPLRVYHSWVNGNESFYFKGQTDALNVALKRFSRIKAEKRYVILRPSPGTVGTFQKDQKFVFNWQLHLLGGIAKHMSTRDLGHHAWNPNPELIVYVGGDIILQDINLPENVDVLQLSDLKARYAKALKSSHQDVRGWTCGLIASLDEFDLQSMNRIATMLDDSEDWVKLNAAGALVGFQYHSKETITVLQGVKTENENLQKRIASTIETLQAVAPVTDAKESHAQQLADIAEFVRRHHSAPQ